MFATKYTAPMRDVSDWMLFADAESAWAGKVTDINGRRPVAIERHLYKPIARLMYTRPKDRDPLPWFHPNLAPLYTCFDLEQCRQGAAKFPHVPGEYDRGMNGGWG